MLEALLRVCRPALVRSIVVVALSVSSFAFAHARTNHALLVAVSEYPNLEKRYWLRGPKNDAVLVRDFLLKNELLSFKADNVITLADGVENADAPTLAAIRKSFATLAARLQPGDFVYLHFSGHGSQAPAINPDSELDGLDELFLPADVGPWNDTVGTVENALVDDEIGKLIGMLRAKGATVWTVFDSCHSGTVTRGAPAGAGDDVETPRKLTSDALKIPDDRLVEAGQATTRGTGPTQTETSALVSKPTGNAQGEFIAFYAAQTNETTPEMRLPAGKKGRKPHGLFTHTLFETIAQFPGLTYRQLGQEILRRYSTTYRVQPTPLFEGDLDASVFGLSGAKAVRQWQVAQDAGKLTIPAGQIQGLNIGDQLLLLNSPAEGNNKALAKLRVSDVQSLTATLEIDGDAFIELPEFAHARQIDKSINFSLAIAKPDISSLRAEEKTLFESTLANLTGEEDTGLRLTIVETGGVADLRLGAPTQAQLEEYAGKPLPQFAGKRHVWILPPSGQIVADGPAKSFSISLYNKEGKLRSAEMMSAVMTDTLARIARTTNLLKLGGVSGPADLGLAIKLQTRKGKGKPFTALDPAAVAELVPGDEVHFEAKNDTTNPLDLNVLYVGSDYSISFMYNGRIKPGETLKKGLLRINNSSFGREKLLLVTTQTNPQSPVADLSWLTQGALERTRGKQSGFGALLRQSGFGTTTRGAAPLSDDDESGQGTIAQIEIQTRPSQ